MKLDAHISNFRRDDSGATLVEFALVMPIFLLLFFGLIDFSRIGFSYVMAGKATERAARIAVVQPPLCLGVPEIHTRGSNTASIAFGASCSLASGLCQSEAEVTCTLSTTTAAGLAFWDEIRPLMPTNATPANTRLRYEFSEDLGFLGGPYTPVVTVEIENLDFEFVTPLGALLALAGDTSNSTVGNDFAFPSMSASLPAEALFDGDI